ncbi:MAG: rod shape-determining protein MreD [Rikenellaceae bacterium]
MFRITPYIMLFLTAVLSQIFFFDNLAVSILFSPLVYIVFIVLLPVEISQILMLALSILLGVTLDATMGTEGINSIATIFVAFFRAPLLKLIVGKERALERGVPSEIRLGHGDYFRYMVTLVAAHHAIFFLFESLTLSNLHYTLGRFGISTAMTILFVWLISRIFTINNILK